MFGALLRERTLRICANTPFYLRWLVAGSWWLGKPDTLLPATHPRLPATVMSVRCFANAPYASYESIAAVRRSYKNMLCVLCAFAPLRWIFLQM